MGIKILLVLMLSTKANCNIVVAVYKYIRWYVPNPNRPTGYNALLFAIFFSFAADTKPKSVPLSLHSFLANNERVFLLFGLW